MSLRGLSVAENRLGFTAIRWHYSAHPDKDVLSPDPAIAARAEDWLEETRRAYPDPAQFAQEFELNWFIAAGTRVYPEFSETLHCKEVEGFRERKVIYRAWDFGYHAPCCLIAQIDSRDRLVVLKELIGKAQTTRAFAQDVVKACAAWFPEHTAGYEDFCDPAGQQVSANSNEKSEARDVEVLQLLGIHPSWAWGWSRKDGRSLVHQLLVLRQPTPGEPAPTPGIYVNAIGCPILLQGFLGKYVYPAKKGGGAAHDEPDESLHPWSDAHAALRYLCTGLYTALGLRRVKQPAAPQAATRWHGYGTPVSARRR